jgi:hypothetical protein
MGFVKATGERLSSVNCAPESRRMLPAAFVVFVVTILIPIAPKAQGVGGVAGTVSDGTKSPLPGVKVTVTTTSLPRTTVTDSDGRYQFRDLPSGTYTVTVELPGFETAVENNVVVKTGAVTGLSFGLTIGCVDEAVRVDLGLAWALREADAIVQIRISESRPPERCPVTGFCVCTEHVAVANRVLKAPLRDASLTTIRFLQEGTGDIGAEKRYAPGQEYVALLRWDPAADRFLRIAGPTYTFPIRDGRVEFRRTDAPGIADGMPVEDFLRALGALLPLGRGQDLSMSRHRCQVVVADRSPGELKWKGRRRASRRIRGSGFGVEALHSRRSGSRRPPSALRGARPQPRFDPRLGPIGSSGNAADR